VSAKSKAVPYLKKFLSELQADGHIDSMDPPIRSWVIPISPLKRTYSERVLAVGDAAGQTKPTTGGGIFYGLLCAEAAAETALRAFQKGEFGLSVMRGYERAWRNKVGGEIKTGALFRRLAEKLSDSEIDDLFRIVHSDGILASISRNARFDWHRDVISFVLRHPSLGRVFLKRLFQ
jgi:flavin-dependent dehydrogenase